MQSTPRAPDSDDSLARLATASAWALGVGAALWLVWARGPRFPYQDDFALVAQLAGRIPPTWRWLWNGYNDHRYALSWAILLATHKLAGGDHRLAMTLSVALLAGGAALVLGALRRIRGRASAWDGALALSWLHWGHWWNLLMSFQLWLVLSSVLVGVWIALFAAGEARLTRRRAFAAAPILLALPLLAGSGALSTPPLALSALGVALWSWRAPERGRRGAAALLAAGALASLAIFAAYLHGFERSFNEANDDRLSSQLVTLAQFLGLGVGPSRWAWWPAPGAAAALMLAVTAALLARAFVRAPHSRGRDLPLLGALGVVAALSAGIAWGRTAVGANLGQEVRYVTLLLPLSTLAIVVWELHSPPRARALGRALLGAATLAGVLNGARDGWRSTQVLRERALAFEADVAAGLTSAQLAQRHVPWMFPQSFDLARSLSQLRSAKLPPFDRQTFADDIDGRAVGPFAGFDPQPDGGAPLKRILPREFGGREVASLGAPGELVFRVQPGERRMEVTFGLHDEAARRSDGLLFEVELRIDGGATRVLFSTELIPAEEGARQPSQRIEVRFAADAPGELALVTRNALGKHDRWDRAWWADFRLR